MLSLKRMLSLFLAWLLIPVALIACTGQQNFYDNHSDTTITIAKLNSSVVGIKKHISSLYKYQSGKGKVQASRYFNYLDFVVRQAKGGSMPVTRAYTLVHDSFYAFLKGEFVPDDYNAMYKQLKSNSEPPEVPPATLPDRVPRRPGAN